MNAIKSVNSSVWTILQGIGRFLNGASTMKCFCVLLALATVVYGSGYEPGLRVTYGAGSDADKDYFFSIPRTVSDAQGVRWRETQRSARHLPNLKMYCPPGRVVCGLYDPKTGYIAGLQIALPVETFQWGVVKPEKNFQLWHAPETEDEPAADYWTINQYYVSEGSPSPTKQNGGTTQQGSLWLEQGGKLVEVPVNEQDLEHTNFKKQNCIPKMGTHYVYNLSPNMKCEDLFPWFLLASRGNVVGAGLMMYGKVNRPRHLLSTRDWFEKYQDPKITFNAVMPDAPTCLAENMAQYGAIFLHVYHINEPWTITC